MQVQQAPWSRKFLCMNIRLNRERWKDPCGFLLPLLWAAVCVLWNNSLGSTWPVCRAERRKNWLGIAETELGCPEVPLLPSGVGPVAFRPKAECLCSSQNLWGLTNQKLQIFLPFEPELWLGDSEDILYYSFPENLLFSYTVDEHSHQDLPLKHHTWKIISTAFKEGICSVSKCLSWSQESCSFQRHWGAHSYRGKELLLWQFCTHSANSWAAEMHKEHPSASGHSWRTRREKQPHSPCQSPARWALRPNLEFFRVPESCGPTELNSPKMRITCLLMEIPGHRKLSKRREALSSFVFLWTDQQGFSPQFCTTTHHARPFFQIVFLIFFRFYYLTTFNLKSTLNFMQWKSLAPHFLKLLKFIISRRRVT